MFSRIEIIIGLLTCWMKTRGMTKVEDSGNQNDLLSSQNNYLSITSFLLLAFQLGLLLIVIHQFRVEEIHGFVRISPLILIGFVINAWLPYRFRLPFFLILSLVAIWKIFGFSNGIILIGIGLILIGICHLPIPFFFRVIITLIAGGVLAAVRIDWIHVSWSSTILPILGSMFMFRMIIYLYDIRHETKPVTVWHRVTYFFLLPNVCFPLFPVVDYKTYCLTYYNDESYKIYKKGIHWMLLGIIQLMLYRLVYYYIIPSPSDVENLSSLVIYMVSSWLFFLRISGQFHLIVGIICLFGFNLPNIFNYFLLSSSFNDFFRRTNIYWKDFMMKIFYYPILFKTSKKVTILPILIAMILIFLFTWLLHSYQWFWLRGTFPLTLVDAIFWGILGGSIIINSMFEVKRGRSRSWQDSPWIFRNSVISSLQTVGIFTFMCIIMSFWSSTSVSEWISLVSVAANSNFSDFLWVSLILFVFLIMVMFAQFVISGGRATNHLKRLSFVKSNVLTASTILPLILFGIPEVNSHFGSKASSFIQSMREDKFNQRDEELFTRGYYETLLDADKYNSQIWRGVLNKPRDWPNIAGTKAIRWTGNELLYELNPLFEGTFKRATLRTNRWGMRDKDYEMKKPHNTYRIALLGGSYEMGSGVENDETFDAVLEERLNHLNNTNRKYEILNFAVAGYSVIPIAELAEIKVPYFEPDAVFYVSHLLEDWLMLLYFDVLISEGVTPTDEFLIKVIKKSGIEEYKRSPDDARKLKPFEGWGHIARQIKPFKDEIIKRSYKKIVEACRKQGAVPVWIALPESGAISVDKAEIHAKLLEFAKEAGFITLSLDGVYKDHDRRLLQIAPWDHHPNARAHRLVADRLYQLLRDNDQQLNLGLYKQIGEKQP